ncbi:MAG: hypothetical protein JWR74_2478 [Polaromonas sp.]|nr:hypothetical protein [Polaromonas sp.]
MKKWKLVLTQGLLAGSLASIFSTAVLAVAGRRETGSAVAPTNAVSHWYWGDQAFDQQQADLAHTVTGYLTHHAAATFWATLYAALATRQPVSRTTPGVLLGAAATSAAAYLVDFKLTPRRFTPGYEHRLSTEALLAVHVGLAAGLAAGALVLRNEYRDMQEKLKHDAQDEPPQRIVRHVRAGGI